MSQALTIIENGPEYLTPVSMASVLDAAKGRPAIRAALLDQAIREMQHSVDRAAQIVRFARMLQAMNLTDAAGPSCA